MSRLTRRLSILVLLSISLCPGSDARAGRIRELGLADMADRSGRIFHGTCIERAVTEPVTGGRPYTTYTFEVIEPIKGVGEEETRIRFSVLSTPDGRGFAGIPVFDVGQELLLVLYPAGPKGMTSPMGLDQGSFRVTENAEGDKTAVNSRKNRGLFVDVPSTVLRARDLDESTAGPVKLQDLQRILRSLTRKATP